MYHDWHAQPGYYGDITRHFAPGMRVLDIGCGTGWLGRHLENYVGLDTDPDAVATGVAEGRDVRLATAGAGLDLPDASFDGVILKDVLEHLTDPVGMVAEVHRVLRPGGVAWASSPDAQRAAWHDYTHVRPYTKVAMARLFGDQGFEVRKVSYESVARGSGRTAELTRRKRRIAPYRMAAHVRFLPRNVWILVERRA